MGLHLAELRGAAPARLVPPDAERGRETGIVARDHPRIVEIPLTRVHDHAVADGDVRDLVTHRVDDARRVGPHDVEVGGLPEARLALGDVDGLAPGRPDVVEVHARRHDHDERVVRPQLGHIDDLVDDGRRRITEPI